MQFDFVPVVCSYRETLNASKCVHAVCRSFIERTNYQVDYGRVRDARSSSLILYVCFKDPNLTTGGANTVLILKVYSLQLAASTTKSTNNRFAE
jgi:hypothetical protein